MALTTIVDVGNYSAKYAYKTKKGIECNSFSSILHPYKPLEESLEGVRRIQYGILDYYIGKAVENFYFGRNEQMYFGNTRKGHHEAQVRLVRALYEIHKETSETEFNLILTCPYDSMTADKQYFTDKFEGERTAIVDGEEFNFKVNRIIMAAEGLGALHFSEYPNCAIVDAGSMTLNVLYLINGTISKVDSHTINGGTIQNSPFALASNFAKTCTNIDYHYPLVCTGGKAKEMKEALSELGYSNITVAELPNGKPSYYVNAVGLLLKYSEKFEVMFAS